MEICDISALFGVDAAEYTQISTGHINLTFIVASESGERYILQSLNREVFNSPEDVMLNISAIESAFDKESDIHIPCYMRCNGRNYAEYGGEIWRMYPYIPDAESGKKDYMTGFSHGRFIRFLSMRDIELKPAIIGFHNYSAYVEKLRAVCNEDAVMEKLIRLGYRLETVFCDIPKRIIHGDAKADNIITGSSCTIIDLDTVMAGYAAIDYGDMIRSSDISCYEELTKGFADGLDGILTENEADSLYYGVLWVTGELAVRYLIDVYSEKPYFKGKTREQCRERAESLMKQLETCENMKNIFESLVRKHF